METYNIKYIPQREIARQFRVTVQLVRDIINDSKKKPEKLREAKDRVKMAAERNKAIKLVIDGF